MKKKTFCALLLLLFIVAGCGTKTVSTPEFLNTNEIQTEAAISTITETVPAAIATVEQRTIQKITVSNAQNDGEGSFRQALLNALPGDVIIFDTMVFSIDAPASIKPTSPLPELQVGQITIDASNAGVILDGSLLTGEWDCGLQISSDGNLIQGLQIMHFSGAGIKIENSNNNVIGGDPKNGQGPIGEGVLVSDNAVGVGIKNSNHNQLMGMRIGVDVMNQPLPNHNSAVFIEESSKGNEIGPDNVIHATGNAIEIRSPLATGNILILNTFIHVDRTAAFRYQNEIPSPRPPALINFDILNGYADGVTCGMCTVELFSENNDQITPEVSTTADAYGYFSIEKQGGFSGPNLITMGTDMTQSSSPFSDPTNGERRIVKLQNGNNSPLTLFEALPSEELQNNWIGETYSGVRAENTPNTEFMANYSNHMGYKWIRLSFSEFSASFLEKNNFYSPTDFGEFEDQVIDNLNNKHIAIMYNLTYFDPKYPTDGVYYRFTDEKQIQEYLDYVKLVVTHFKGRIQYYETWNEPDLYQSGQQSIAVDDYINVIRRLVQLIHEIDPEAKIVIGGGSALTQQFTQNYLNAILDSDVVSMVDGISIHPMYGSSPDYAELIDYYENYPEFIKAFQEKAQTSGFEGIFMAEEMVWRTAGHQVVNEPWIYSDVVAAKYYLRGIVINRGLDMAAGIGGEGMNENQVLMKMLPNLNTIMAGMEPVNVDLKVDNEVNDIRWYAFNDQAGNKIIAIWRDVKAVDFDEGSPINVEIDTISNDIFAVDLMFSFQQPMQI